MAINVVSVNKNKANEVRDIIKREVFHINLMISEIQDIDLVKVAKDKAFRAFKRIREPILVENSGLFLNSYRGFPGALVGELLRANGPTGVSKMVRGIDNRQASSESVVCYYDGSDHLIFQGKLNGTVLPEPRGTDTNAHNYSYIKWGTVFVPEGQSLTYAEMKPEDRISVSARTKALLLFKLHLDTLENGQS